MTKFNPENKQALTFGEVLGPIFFITDKADAIQYKQAYMLYIQKTYNLNEADTKIIADINIGYYAAYGSQDCMKRIEELFEVRHPIYD